MKALGLFPLLVATFTVSASSIGTDNQPLSKRASLPPIKTRGNAFWAGSKRFYIRGIDYQPGGSSAQKDPLADPDICLRDIKQLEELGVNTIRVYTIDNSKSHDECMQALSDAGIYLILDVNSPTYSINRLNPKPSYNTKYLQNVFATVEMFAQYKNTLAFFSGNEVINNEPGTDKSAPFVKAVTRDIKNYINSRGLRAIPVGYSAADVPENRLQLAMYLNCGSDDTRSDFFAFNDYSWCNSDFETSGWNRKVKDFTDYGLPIFLSEWGCNRDRPRKFEEFSALMSTNMTSVYSGGLMYEYSLEENQYGIVALNGATVKRLDEFKIFKEALEKYPAPSGDGLATNTSHAVACPTPDSSWNVNPSLVPQMPQQAEKFMKYGAGRGPGLGGDGSQNAADSGTATASVASGVASPTATNMLAVNDDEEKEEREEKENGTGAIRDSYEPAIAVTGFILFFSMFGGLRP